MPSLFVALFAILFFLAILGFAFWANWKAHTPRGFAYFCGMFFWMSVMVYAMINSTFPSTMPRKQITGRFDSVLKHGQGRSANYTFDIVLSSGAEMSFREGVSPPAHSHNQLLLVTYLDEKVANEFPRAIGAEILTGPATGSRSSVSANWFGPWLFCPLGILGIFWCSFQAHKYLRKGPKSSEDNVESNI